LLIHFNEHPPHVNYENPINPGQKGVPLLENLFTQYQENVNSLEVHTASGTSYSVIEGILRGNQSTPQSISSEHDTYDQTLSSLRYLLQTSADIKDQLKQPGIASRVVSELIAQDIETRMGLKELRR